MANQLSKNSLRRRLVIAVDNECYSAEILQAAASMAKTLEAEIQCVYFENERLLELADLPFTSEVLLSNAMERSLSRDSMTRTLKMFARQIQEDVEKLAVRDQLVCSFETCRAASLLSLLDQITPSDFLLLSGKNLQGQFFAQQLDRKKQTDGLGALLTGSSADLRVLENALLIARAEQKPLHLVVMEAVTVEHPILQQSLANVELDVIINRFAEMQEALAALMQMGTLKKMIMPFESIAADEELMMQLLALPGRQIMAVR